MRNGENTILAVSDSKDCIDKHWDYVTQHFLPAVEEFEESEAMSYVVKKVEALSKEEEGEVGKKDTRREEFRINFPELEAEKFVTYYDGLIWEAGKITPIKCIIYILEESIAVHSLPSYKVIIQFYDISSITKEKTFGLLSNTIKIITKENKEYWFNVVKRDAVYQVMEHLWRDAMRKWQYSLDPDGLGLYASTSRTKIGTTMAQLDSIVKMQEFKDTFKVPECPKTENDCYKAILKLSDNNRWILGRLYITENFLCFQAKHGVADVKIIIAFVNILDLSPHDHVDARVEDFPDMKGIKILTKSTNEFIFCVSPRDSIIMKIFPQWSERANAHRKIKRSLPIYVCKNGWGLTDDVNDTNYKLQQENKIKIWESYFKRNGYIDDPILSNRFTTIIQEEGIPDIYRGKLWQICSGSIHHLESQPKNYHSLLNDTPGDSTVEAEIERDVTRSLPHHPFFKTEDGVSQLRNVLVAYSRCAHHIGYCQAMNIVAATLLLYMSEEEAYWMLWCICEEIIPEHYTKGLQLMGSVVEQQIFTELTQIYFPVLKQHLEEIGTPVEMLTLPWFMTFFIGYIPWKAALRVLDLVFIMGPDVLFLVGLGVLLNTKDKIMTLDEGTQVSVIFKEVCKDNPEGLIKDAFSKFNTVTKDTIQSLRQKKKFEMMQSLQETTLNKVFEDLSKIHPKIKLAEFKNIYREFEKLAVKKTTEKVVDSAFKSSLIDCTQFQKLLYYFFPHLEFESEKIEPILFLLFKRGDRKDKQLMDFEEFIDVFEILWRGSIFEQFNLCYSILYSSEEKITKDQFHTMVHILYKLTYSGSTPWDQNSIRLEMFVTILYESLDGHKDSLTYDQLFAFLTEKNLLEDFWKQLFRG